MADEEDSSPTEASGWFSDRALQHRAIQTKVQEAIVRHKKANRANDNGAGEDIVVLRTGDLIYLQRTPDKNGEGGGVVVGDMNLRTVGVQAQDDESSHEGSWRFENCVFRICCKLNYFAKGELAHLDVAREKREQAMQEARAAGAVLPASKDDARFAKDYALAKERVEIERRQNAAVLEELEGGGVPIKYGDVVQLQHLPSDFFLTLLESGAPVDISCRKVNLEPEGSFNAHFQLMPRFRSQTLGSPVTAGSGITLQSVNFGSLTVAIGHGPDTKREPAVFPRAKPQPGLNMRLPRELRHAPIYEVNGSLEQRGGFTLQVFNAAGSEDKPDALKTSMHAFRIFHPEHEQFLVASGNADKGEVLDCVSGCDEDGAAEVMEREGGVPAHIPYFRPSLVGKNRTGMAHGMPLKAGAHGGFGGHIKGLWSFELMDRSEAGIVEWRSPLRVRHVPSGKYLSVDSLDPVELSDQGGKTKRDKDGKAVEYYNVALVHDVDPSAEPGAYGSAESMVFFVNPEDPQPPQVVPSSISVVSLEHYPHCGGTLYMDAMVEEPKPRMGRKPQDNKKLRGSVRVLFTSSKPPDAAVRILPCPKHELKHLKLTLSKIPLLKLYAYKFLSAAGETDLLDCAELAEPVVTSLLRLLTKMDREWTEAWAGKLLPERVSAKYKSTLEFMKAANNMEYPELLAFFQFETDMVTQTMACETKLLDALVNASLAPYNRVKFQGKPFDVGTSRAASDLPRALQAVLNVTLQVANRENAAVQKYFSTGRSRAWIGEVTGDTGEGGSSGGSGWRRRWGRQDSKATDAEPPRKTDFWYNLLVYQSEDELGSANVLTELIKSSQAFSAKVYSTEFIRLIKSIIGRIGPQRRLLDVLSALCFVGGVPSKVRQEMCIRELLSDPYAYGLSLHELPDLAGKPDVPEVRPRVERSAKLQEKLRGLPKVASSKGGKGRYLGEAENNAYAPVLVAWSSPEGAQGWEGGSGKGLWWSAEWLGLPRPDQVYAGNEHKDKGYLDLVPIEYLLWPLDPHMCYKEVFDEDFNLEDFGFEDNDKKKKQSFKEREAKRRNSKSGSFHIAREMTESASREKVQKFKAHFKLAEFLIAQIDLMVACCTARSMMCIKRVCQQYSYGLLMNLSSNDKLPSIFRASVIKLVNCLYLDRYPQLPANGAPHFPEALWVYAEEVESPDEPILSNTPVLAREVRGITNPEAKVAHHFRLDDEAAFPVFAVSPLSFVSNDKDPVMSHPDDRKFFLLQHLCSELIDEPLKKGIVQSDDRTNRLVLSALETDSLLFDFGFEASYDKMRDVAKNCARILDGRSELRLHGVKFESSQERYRQGSRSAMTSRMKKLAIENLLRIADLRANFRLGKLLILFKEHASKHESPAAVKGHPEKEKPSIQAATYLTGQNQEKLFGDFEDLFTKDEAANLDLSILSENKRIDQLIMDCAMHDDDELLAACLRLLFSSYGQRKKLRKSLDEVVLLAEPTLPVFDSVHALRSQTADLFYFLQTYSVWGVKSDLSGEFGNEEFGKTMETIERLLLFLHDFDAFKARIRMVPYSILGSRMNKDKTMVAEGKAGPLPHQLPENCAFVDPAGLSYIHPPGGPCKVTGASQSIHTYMGTRKDTQFHPDIMKGVTKVGHAKYHKYTKQEGGKEVEMHVIHAVGPDFRRKHEPGMPPYTWDEGVELLCQAYHNILVQFIASEQKVLRLTPVSGGAQAGPFKDKIPELAEKGMRGGFARLTQSQQAHVLKSDIKLCIFMEHELPGFFQAGFIPDDEARKMINAQEEVEAEDMGAASKEQGKGKNYSDTRSLVDLGGKAYEVKGLWSLDVAEKWQEDFDRLPVMGKFQDVLRAFNVQRLFTDSVLGKGRMDPRIAWKGSLCHESEKDESVRRLELVNAALLTLAIKFVAENRENQSIVAENFDELQVLASGHLALEDAGEDAQSFGSSKGKDAYTLSGLAQELILAVLRGNERLVESKVGPELVKLFVDLVNKLPDVSKAREIDLFFVLAKPEHQPLEWKQISIAREILSAGVDSDLVKGLKNCLDQVAASAAGADKQLAFAGNDGDDPASPEPKALENPARLVQLIYSLVEGGNADAWLELQTHAGVSLDGVCAAGVAFIESKLDKGIKFVEEEEKKKAKEEAKERERQAKERGKLGIKEEAKEAEPRLLTTWAKELAAQKAEEEAREHAARVRNAAVTKLLESGTGKVLVDLLVEAVIIVPHTKVSLKSKSLWRFVEVAAVPCLAYFTSRSHPTALEIGLITQVVEFLHHVLSEQARLGLLEDAFLDHQPELTEVRKQSELVIDGRSNFYQELRDKFTETVLIRQAEDRREAQDPGQWEGYGDDNDSDEDFVFQGGGHDGNMNDLPGMPPSPKAANADGLRRLVRDERKKSSVVLSPPAAPSSPRVARNMPSISSGARAARNMFGFGSRAQEKALAEGTLDKAEFLALMKFLAQRGDGDTPEAEAAPSETKLIRSGSLPGINYLGDDSLERYFEEADEDGDESIDIEEFIALFEKVMEDAMNLGGARVHIYHRISKRTVECVERMQLISRREYNALKDLKEPRVKVEDEGGRSGKTSAPGSGGESFDEVTNPRVMAALEPDEHDEDILSEADKRAARVKAHQIAAQLPANFEDQFSAFKKSIKSSKKIENRIRDRRFEMVSILEEGIPKSRETLKRETAEHGHHPAKMKPVSGALQLTKSQRKKLEKDALTEVRWEDLTRRFVRYVKVHFRDEGGRELEACRLIFNIWIQHLVKARPKEMNSSLESQRKQREYKDKQEALDECGVTNLLTRIIITLPAGSEGSVQDTALELFAELLWGGNSKIQSTLYEYVDTRDPEGRFLAHLVERLDREFLGLRNFKHRGLLGRNATFESKELAENAAQTVNFLHLLCEGHNHKFQNLLREQPKNAVEVNLVDKAVLLLVLIVDSSATVKNFCKQECDLVYTVLKFLTEAMQGPCGKNQVLVTSVEVINAVNAITGTQLLAADEAPSSASSSTAAVAVIAPARLRASGLTDLAEESRKLCGAAAEMLAACLENRLDKHTHDAMVRRLELRALGAYRDDLENQLRDLIGKADAKRRVLNEKEKATFADSQQALANIENVALHLKVDLPTGGQTGDHGHDDSNAGAHGGGGLLGGGKRQGQGKGAKQLKAQQSLEEHTEPKKELSRSASNNSLLEGTQLDSSLHGGAGARAKAHDPFGKAVAGSMNELEEAEEEAMANEEDDEEEKDDEEEEMDGMGDELKQAKPLKARALLGTVEVAWQGKIERAVFPLPADWSYLTPKTQGDFMSGVSLDTSDIRMQEVIRTVPVFEAEMTLVHKRSVESKYYILIQRNIMTIKYIMYTFVMLLNVNVLLSPRSIGQPALIFFENMGWLKRSQDALTGEEFRSLVLIIALGGTNFIGYFLIMFHLARTEVPIMLKEYVSDLANKKAETDPSRYFDFTKFYSVFLVLFFNITLVIIHLFNAEPLWFGYLALFLLVNVPHTLMATRAAIVVPSGGMKQAQWIFCVLFDVLIASPTFRNYVFWVLCLMAGFFESQFFTLILLDIMTISTTLHGILKSITQPGLSLVLVFYLFLVTVIIYAAFGFSYFPGYFAIPATDDDDADDATKECATVLQCFYFIFYTQMAGEAGFLADTLRVPNPDSDGYFSRIIYDSVFFIWVGIVLINVITGLMVDTFSSIREEEATRNQIQKTQCFVCGIDRAAYEDLSMGKKYSSFAQHQQLEHDPWLYVYFLVYLRQKDRTLYNGIESYVSEQVDKKSLDWIPTQDSYGIQHFKQREEARRQNSFLESAHDQGAKDGAGGGGAGGGGAGGGSAGGAGGGALGRSAAVLAAQLARIEQTQAAQADLLSKLVEAIRGEKKK